MLFEHKVELFFDTYALHASSSRTVEQVVGRTSAAAFWKAFSCLVEYMAKRMERLQAAFLQFCYVV